MPSDTQDSMGTPSGTKRPVPANRTAEPPRVVVKFRDDLKIPYEDGIEKKLEQLQAGPWNRLAKRFPRVSLRRMFTAQKPEQIQALVARAAELDPTYRPADLLKFFWLESPPETDLDGLAREHSTFPGVETSYVDRPGPDPVVNAAIDPRSVYQG